MVEKIENRVIASHGMNRKDYEASFLARIDKNKYYLPYYFLIFSELKNIERFMEATMKKAGYGQMILPKIDIPKQMSPAKVFELFVKTERKKILKVANIFAEYIRSGTTPNEMDPEFAKKMESTMTNGDEIEGLDELEIENKEHHPLAIFIMAQTRYT